MLATNVESFFLSGVKVHVKVCILRTLIQVKSYIFCGIFTVVPFCLWFLVFYSPIFIHGYSFLFQSLFMAFNSETALILCHCCFLDEIFYLYYFGLKKIKFYIIS